MKEYMKKRLVLIGSLLSVILYPCLFMYFQNADQSKLTDALPAFVRFLILAGIICAVGYLIMRSLGKSILLTNAVMFISVNFNTLFDRISLVVGRKVVLLVCIIALGILTLIIKQKCKGVENVCLIILICFSVLIIMNFITAVPTIISKFSYSKTEETGKAEDFAAEKPNVYYFIYDEHAGRQGLERYYDWDNKEFMDNLKQLGFNVSDSSHNTESCSTTVNVPNLLNLSYVADPEEIEANNLKYMKNPKLIQIFKENGYTVHLINHTDFLDADDGKVLITSGHVDTISDYILGKSIFQVAEDYYYAHGRGNTEIGRYTNALEKVLRTMEVCASLVDEDNPTLTVGYISCPHVPFVVDSKGESIDESTIHDWKDKELYLNQLKYVNSCIETMVDNIIDSDPDAVIILQSDHGVRYPYHMMECYGTPEYDATIETPYMQNILNCVYYQGKEIDIEGKTGINTLRTVLNEVFMTDYEMLDEPEKYLFQYK